MSLIKSYIRYSPVGVGKGWLLKRIKVPEGTIPYTNKYGVKYMLDTKERMMRHVYLYDIPERNTFRHLIPLLKKIKQPRILDCGANIGMYSLNLAKLFPNAQITAFEPLTNNIPIISKNIEINGFKNITLVTKGVGDKPGKLQMQYGTEPSRASVYINDHHELGAEEIDIVTVDGYCKEHGIEEINCIKIDVEGGEYKVLKGAEQVLRNSSFCVAVVEVIPEHLTQAGDSAQAIFDLMADMGYKSYLPKAWPKPLKEVKNAGDIGEYLDNIFFVKGSI